MCGELKDLLLAGWVCDTCSEILHNPSAEAINNRINDIIVVLDGGEVDSARDRFIKLWKEIENTDDHLNLCKLAQCIARVWENPRDRITWNLRALQAATAITDAELEQVSDASADGYVRLTARAFYPSIHLNLACNYRQVGEAIEAQHHLRSAQSSMDALPRSPYGDHMRRVIESYRAEPPTNSLSKLSGFGQFVIAVACLGFASMLVYCLIKFVKWAWYSQFGLGGL